MIYEVETTNIFDKWLDSLKDKKTAQRIMARVPRIQVGNFGDHKNIEGDLFELRFFFGSGYRVYYIIQGNKIVFLLNGGDKSSQSNDIAKAKDIIKQLE